MTMLSIGQLSTATGVTVETIRYYERKGILPLPARTAAGRRIYSDADTRRLNFIHKCRGLGFSLKEITSLLSLVSSGKFTCNEIHDITTAHIKQVNRKIRQLRKMEDVLATLAAQCSDGNAADCPIIDSLYEQDANSTAN